MTMSSHDAAVLGAQITAYTNTLKRYVVIETVDRQSVTVALYEISSLGGRDATLEGPCYHVTMKTGAVFLVDWNTVTALTEILTGLKLPVEEKL